MRPNPAVERTRRFSASTCQCLRGAPLTLHVRPHSLAHFCGQPSRESIIFKSLLIAASLICVSFAPGITPAAQASEASAASNIGFALYTKSLSPGTLNAVWMYGTKYRGSYDRKLCMT